MEGQTRVKLNYLQQLQMFHAQQGKKNFVKPPLVDRTPIDLHLLAKVVDEKGGPEEVYTSYQLILFITLSLRLLIDICSYLYKLNRFRTKSSGPKLQEQLGQMVIQRNVLRSPKPSKRSIRK